MKLSECSLDELAVIIRIGNEAITLRDSTIGLKESVATKVQSLLRSNLWDTTKTYNPAEIGVGNTYASGYIRGLEYINTFVNEKIQDKLEAEKEITRRNTKVDRSNPMSWLSRLRKVEAKSI